MLKAKKKRKTKKIPEDINDPVFVFVSVNITASPSQPSMNHEVNQAKQVRKKKNSKSSFIFFIFFLNEKSSERKRSIS